MNKQSTLVFSVFGAIATLSTLSCPVWGQITPANDGTHTRVTQEGDRFTIRGGQRSADGANLFHSFEQFGLTADQIANFRTDAQVHNVLGRIVGGDASIIDGLLRVSGSDANLYLINPAGIIFGENARLDVAGSFTATTATALEFSDRWWSMEGTVPYGELLGDPTALAFAGEPATLLNAGHLAVSPNESLLLAGGVVINTGTLEAPGGRVSVVAVPEEQVVRIGQEGSLLSLELEAIAPGAIPDEVVQSSITPLSLPELLTEIGVQHATGVTIDPDGTVRLVGSGLAIPTQGGTAIAAGEITTATAEAQGAPEINLLGDRIGVVDALIDASGQGGGGTVRIGGEYQGNGPLFSSDRLYVNETTRILANAIDQGDGGRVILWSNGHTSFLGDISAQGGAQSGDGGFVEVSGLETLNFQGQVNTLAPNGEAGVLLLDPTNIIVQTIAPPGALAPLDEVDETTDPDRITGDPPPISDYSYVAPATLEAATTNIILQATNSIFFNEAVTIPTNGVGLRAEAGGNIEVNAALSTTNGAIALIAGDNVSINDILDSNGGDLTLSAGNRITVNDFLRTGGGEVTLTAGSELEIDQQVESDGGAIAFSAGTALIVTADVLSGGGNIDLTADADADGIGLLNIGDVVLNAGAGDLTLTGNEIDVGFFSTLQGQGTLTFRPSRANQDILLGGNAPVSPALEIKTQDLGVLTDGFEAVVVGRADGTGTLTLQDDITLTDPLTLQMLGDGGAINSDGFSITTDGATNLLADGNITTADITTNSNALVIDSRNGSIDTTGGTLDTDDGDLTILGQQDLNLGAIATDEGDITLTSTDGGISAGDLTTDEGNLRVTGQQDLNLGVIATDEGNVTLTSTDGGISAGDLTTDEGNLRVTGQRGMSLGTLTTDEGDITLTSPDGSINTDDLTSGAGSITITAQNSTALGAIATEEGNVRVVSRTQVANTGDITTEDGSVTLTGREGVSAGEINAAGGDVRLTSRNGRISTNRPITVSDGGAIAITGAEVAVSDLETEGTNVTVTSTRGDAITGQMSTSGGEISVTGQGTANVGRLDTAGGNVEVTSGEGSAILGDSNTGGGALTVSGPRVVLGTVDTEGGDVEVTSRRDDAILGPLTTEGGDVTVQAEGTLIPSAIETGGGDVTLTSNRSFFTSRIDARDPDDDTVGGAIALSANGALTISSDIRTANRVRLSLNGDLTLGDATIATGGGLFQLENQGALRILGIGAIETGGSDLGLSATSIEVADEVNLSTGGDRASGTLSLTATQGTITVGDLTTAGRRGGDVILRAAGDLTVGDIDASGGDRPGGDITLTSDTSLRAGNLTASGTSGGNVTLTAVDTIRAGQITTRGTVGDGGNVIIDPINVILGWIDAQGGNAGQGGTVDITASQFVQLTDRFTDGTGLETSISTVGGTGGGDITIRHGGNGITPFIVGNSGTNGSAVLNSGTFSIQTGSFLYTYQEGAGLGRILIVSVPEPIVPPIRPPSPDNTEAIAPPEQDPLAPLQIGAVPALTLDTLIDLERFFTLQYVPHFNLPTPAIATLEEVQQELQEIEDQVGVRPAVLYALFTPPMVNSAQFGELAAADRPFESTGNQGDRLELVLVTPEGQPVRVLLPDATREQVETVARQFYLFVTDRTLAQTNLYQTPSRQIYDWMIAPIQQTLQEQGIEHLSFVLDGGLRSLPMAALWNGERFLVEDYSLGLMPSLSLTDTRYADLNNLGILAMGASEFTDQIPLPAVPVELSSISSEPLLNQDFTLDALRSERQQTPFGIIHLATHGEFRPGGPENSYIQFWDDRLELDDVRTLGLNNPQVELMVLSACRTALGDTEAELGFAGFAVQAGVKSALASLWYVSDLGTLALMSEFYEQMDNTVIRADAVRQAQISMLRGNVYVEGTTLFTREGEYDLPNGYEFATPLRLAHPHYWAAFTMVGSPW